MSAEAWLIWVAVLTQGDSYTVIGLKTGKHRNTIRTWIAKPTLDAVTTLARTYEGDLVEGLFAAELITQEDIERIQPRARYARTTSSALSAELADRIEQASIRMGGADPLEWQPEIVFPEDPLQPLEEPVPEDADQP